MPPPSFSEIVKPDTLRIGDAFRASQLRESRFGGLIDPIILVDHFTLTATQETYPHAGLATLTYLFEDSAAARYEPDTATPGVSGLIGPGEIQWLSTGGGTLHSTRPPWAAGAVRGLRVFANIPAARLSAGHAGACHIAADAMPLIERGGVRVRLVAGDSKNVRSTCRLPAPLTLLDCFLDPHTRFAHPMPADCHAVIYVIEGNDLTVTIDGRVRRLESDTAVAVSARGDDRSLVLSPGDMPVHVIVLALPAPAPAQVQTISPATLVAGFRHRRAQFPANGAFASFVMRDQRS